MPELKTDCIESEWIGKKSEKTDLPPRHPMTIYLMRETPEVDIYRSPFLALRINKTTGKIALYRIGSAEELICDWEPYRKGCPNTTFCTEITHHLDGKKVYLSKNCTYEDGTIALINFIFDGASVEVDSKILPSDSSRALIEKAGISIYLSLPAESVSWERNGYYTRYPSDHIGRLSGTAHAYGQNIPYGDKPEHSWGKDTTNHFLFAKTENSCRNVTRDFQTTRDHILQYSVNLSNNWKLNVYPDDADCSALVEQTPQGDVLQITKGNYYPGLRWGNFCGTLMTEASWHTKFTLMIERTNY